MRTLSDLQKRILSLEFPDMNFESDSDIERYFELRNLGRQADALTIYNTRLRRKYPDDQQRTLLMRYYRSHDSRYHEILRDNTVSLAERAITRTTSIIALLTRDIETVDMTDAYSVIKLAEGLLSIISPDRYQSISFSEKYVRYAKILGFRHSQMEKTAELIRLYVTDTIESVLELKKEHEEQRKQRARQQQNRKAQASFDLSRITFNPIDIAKILIPTTIVRTEDIVIAYCIKYWNQVPDIAFEKTIFLYSRKYHTNHNEIFQAIKNGRTHGWKDEEILNAVLANVVTGYYYNISGDLYLQRTWARYKLSLQNDSGTDSGSSKSILESINSLAAEAGAIQAIEQNPVVQTQNNMMNFTPIAHKAGHPVHKPLQEAPKTARMAALHRVRTQASIQSTYPVEKIVENPVVPVIQETKKTAIPRIIRRSAGKSEISTEKHTKTGVPITPFKPQKDSVQSKKPVLPQTPIFIPNSIADIIRKMTGKTYTVYKELFFKGVRQSIRANLSASSDKRGSLFGNRQNDAEELIYNFLFAHYNDPYQNWKESSECKKVAELGYTVAALEPIIGSWIKNNA